MTFLFPKLTNTVFIFSFYNQGWEFALLLFALLLKITLFKERPWGIHSCGSLTKSNRGTHSCHSSQKVNCERIALVALYKRVTRANHSHQSFDALLFTPLLFTKEELWVICSCRLFGKQKWALHSKTKEWIPSPVYKPVHTEHDIFYGEKIDKSTNINISHVNEINIVGHRYL